MPKKSAVIRQEASVMTVSGELDLDELLKRITFNPEILGGKAIIRGRLAVEHILIQMTMGVSIETLLEGYPWLEREDILACLAYAYRAVAGERFMPPSDTVRIASHILVADTLAVE
jgi:uncharacterized protein (DUF433 family)